MQLLTIATNSILLYQLALCCMQVPGQLVCPISVWVSTLLSASHAGSSHQVARVFGMSLNSLTLVPNDQTAVEPHHSNCVRLLLCFSL